MNAPKNVNFCATLVELKDFVDLPNCDNVKAGLIFGNSVIISKDTPTGEKGLYFPPECALSAEFLGKNNLYRKYEFGNSEEGKTGFFEQQGRVKAVKFRGHKSEGFYCPLSFLDYLSEIFDTNSLEVGTVFDFIEEHEICRKYIPRGIRINNPSQTKGKQANLEDSIVEGQFRMHFDTENLRRNIHKVKATDIISISDKWHGTSVVIGNLLVKRKLNWFENLLGRLGVKIQKDVYGLIYSSRRFIKAVNGVTKEANHFYTTDIWGDVAKEVEDRIPKGYTLYGEIVGFTSDGAPIQDKYAYGCDPKEHKFVVYRVTNTNADGKTLELSWPQMEEFCLKFGLQMVPTFFYGSAIEFLYLRLGYYETFEDSRNFQARLLEILEKDYVCDGNCKYNPKGTPAEGIVVRIDRLEEAIAFKLRNFRFLAAESAYLDKGEIDLETSQSEPELEEGI
jgi:hypothetical protein